MLGIVNESSELPMFNPFPLMDISTSAGPDTVGNTEFGNGKESTEPSMKREPVAESETESVDWLLMIRNAFLCSMFSEIILNHFGVKWQKITP